jgi:predicted DCC family thiol-disulfide oxidoreductase YuxK
VSGGTLELAAYQTQDKSDLPAGISTNDLERALQVVLPDGSVRQRADAVFEVMRALPRPWSRLARWGGWPPIRWAANALYEPLARHRQVWSRWLRLDRTPLP